MAYAAENGVSKLHYARMIAAALAQLLSRQGDAVGLVAYADRIRDYLPSRGGQLHLRALLLALARMEPDGETRAAAALGRTVDMMRRRGLIVVISDLYDEDEQVETILQRAAHAGHEVVVFHLLTRDEIGLPFSGDVELADLETGQTIVSNGNSGGRLYRRGHGGFSRALARAVWHVRDRLRPGRHRYAVRRSASELPPSSDRTPGHLMIWLVPAALAGLILVAGPLALHLLTRHQARRVAFPTIRFVQPSNTAAVRPQNPTDVWLMCLRMAAIACAAAAAAQPLLLSGWRVASWNARIARASLSIRARACSCPMRRRVFLPRSRPISRGQSRAAPTGQSGSTRQT